MGGEKAKDEVRAGAWRLAAETSKSKAADFLRQIADELEKALWDHNR